ncbi:MAG: hypothetical protein FWG98_10435 [Candidatus Cloacimonetes bacterium]|nr:hypothetical protein [Candidatus Cloacimonadota bacterium]
MSFENKKNSNSKYWINKLYYSHWIWVQVLSIVIMILFLLWIYFIKIHKTQVIDVFWTAVFSSIIGSVVTLIFSCISELITRKRNKYLKINTMYSETGCPFCIAPSELLETECPFINISWEDKFPCHAPHIKDYESIGKAWEDVLSYLVEYYPKPTINVLKIYASKGKIFVSNLNVLLNEIRFHKICIEKIQLIIKSKEDNILEDEDKNLDQIIKRNLNNNISTVVEYADIPDEPLLLTHYMCVIDNLFTIFGCNTAPQATAGIESNKPFVASNKTKAGAKLVSYQGECFDKILEKNRNKLSIYVPK